ncbi:MAG: isoleucine--tRNA ligase [Nitrospinota bacterium]
MDYKTTLQLPKTEFAMKANLPLKEVEILAKWTKMDLYENIRHAKKGKELYILHDGPPYANGHIHAGTALNKILKDIVVKSKTMLGFDVPFVPGWDCHGLPIELNVDKELGSKKREISTIEFRKLCREYAERFVDSHREEFKRLGVFADWDNPYLTISKEYEIGILKVLAKFVEQGLVVKGNKPVHWCPSCVTALAEAEVEHKEKKSPSIFVKFKLTSQAAEKLALTGDIYTLIWTTTPWTLPANRAICFNSNFDYSAYKVNGEILILATELAEKVFDLVGIDNYQIVKSFKGSEFENLEASHPFIDMKSKMILGNHVSLEQGTGIVHTAPGHGGDDYIVGRKYNLEVYNPVNRYGKFTNEIELVANLSVWKANDRIIELLEENGRLLHKSNLNHSYPHCWRCRKPLIFLATPQWFISMDNNQLREKVLAGINSVNWMPSWGLDRIYSMVESRPDWCISRQRVWGVPILSFDCTKCDTTIFNKESVDYLISILEQEGVDHWFELRTDQLMPEGKSCPTCGADEFVKSKDILDVWFDSGVSHEVVLQNDSRLRWPADLYLEGSDQHRGWFQTSMICSIGTRGEAPYKETLTHGYVVDGRGEKMSKSIGNSIRPQAIIDQYGAEIVRLWVASEDYKEDIRISDEILKRLVDAYRKIRNTIRFMLGNIVDFDPQNHYLNAGDRTEIDRYLLGQLRKLSSSVVRSYKKREFHLFYHRFYNFCVVDLSSFYLDIIKDRIYTYPLNSNERRAAQSTMFDIVTEMTKLMAPVLSFTAEEVWEHLPKSELTAAKSVHLTEFETISKDELEDSLGKEWDRLIVIRNEVLKALESARQKSIIGHSLDAKVRLSPFESDYQLLAKRTDFLPFLFIVSQVELELEPSFAPTYKSEIAPGLTINIERADGEKCARCWNYTTDIGVDKQYQDICGRCAQNITE